MEISETNHSRVQSSFLPLKMRQLGTVNPLSSQIEVQFMFGNTVDTVLMGLLRTHPPLAERVRRLRLIEQERRKNM